MQHLTRGIWTALGYRRWPGKAGWLMLRGRDVAPTSPNGERRCLNESTRLLEDRDLRRGGGPAGSRAVRGGPGADRHQGARLPDPRRRRQGRAGRRGRLLRPRRRGRHRGPARLVQEGLPEDQDQLRAAAGRRALREDHRRALGRPLRRRRAPALRHLAGHRLPEEGRLGGPRLTGAHGVQGRAPVGSRRSLHLGRRQLRRHLLQPRQGEARAGAQDVEGHPQPGVQGRGQRQARHLRHAARPVVRAAQALRQRLLAGVRPAAAKGLRRPRPALRPAVQRRRPHVRARRVRRLHALRREGRGDRVRGAARRTAGHGVLHRRRQSRPPSRGGQALRGLGAGQARPGGLPEPEDPPLRLAADRRAADAHRQAAGGFQAPLPHGLERLRGEPPCVREGVELDHGFVSLSPRLVGVLVGGGAAVLVLYPIAYLLQASLSVGDPQARPPEAYGLANFADLPRYSHIFGNTLLVAGVATVLAIVFGFVMGWILSRTNVPGRAAFEQLMALPYYVTPLMGALAWALIGSPASGFVNQLWRALGGDGHLVDINTPWGIAWVMALFEGSVAFVMIAAVMKSMDPALEEASQVMGASRLRTMLRITLPLVLPGVLGAAVFVFAEMLGSFAVALVLGLPDRYYVVTTAIYQLVQQYPPKIPLAAAMGTSLFVVMFVTLFIYRRIITAGSYVTITGKAFRPRVNDVGRLKYVLLAICLFYLFCAVVLPLLTLFYASIQKISTAFPVASNFTTEHFYKAFTMNAATTALGNSRWLALWLLLIAYLTVFLPLGVRTISGVMLQIDKSLEECAQMCGAGWGYRIRTVTVPLLWPGLLAAWLLLFVASIRELGASILLMGPHSKVITPSIVESWFASSTELTAAMALIQTAVVAIAVSIMIAVTRRATTHITD